MGWKRPDGTRLYRKAFFSTARKNAKTQICAAIALLLLVLDNEQSPEVYLAAKTREQASRVYQAAADMIRASKELSQIMTVVPYSKTITCSTNNGILKAVSGEGKSLHGLSPTVCIIDELHALGEGEREMMDALTTGSGARRQSLHCYITTAGTDLHSIWGEEYDYVCKVRDGIIDDPYYYVQLHEVPKEAIWTDESLYWMANPCIGDIVTLDYLIEKRDQALAQPSLQTAFRRLYLNQFVNATSTWIPLDKFDLCQWDKTTCPI